MTNEIAIIGIGCRFPGDANGPEAFWDMVVAARDAVSEIPADRWSVDKHFNSERTRAGKTYSRWGGFIKEIDQFDARFFGISPREAQHMDPQQRLLLEVSWEALEDAGVNPKLLEGSRTGVFMGAFTMDHQMAMFKESNGSLVEGHTATGTMMTLIANRISHAFDFQGPSVAMDTACSSSLVAVHVACNSLKNGDCNIALVGGVNAMFMPDFFIAESKAGMLSPDGRSKTFDARANGYVRGEGAGVVVLKPYAQAVADGDPIYAVIRGSAVNQDGRTPGITVPSGDAQSAAMRDAYANANVNAMDVQYVEAHGTGTPVGDPIEANALGRVLSINRPDDQPCYVGSVKANFGHTEAAAGVAGLIKATLAVSHAQIPPLAHFQSANPQINFEFLKLKVPTQLTEWPDTHGKPRMAGINSFGFGGTNAHVLIVSAPALGEDSPAKKSDAYFIPLSARSPESLRKNAGALADYLQKNPDASLGDIGYTLAKRRFHHDVRTGVSASTASEFVSKLNALAATQDSKDGKATQARLPSQQNRLVFVFAGMGPQWWGMGRQLYAEQPVFRVAADEVFEIFEGYAGWSLKHEMIECNEDESRMSQTEVSQPANFVLQLGLYKLWESWGVSPAAIVGHSAGEPAAAYAAGALSLAEATRVIYHRSRLQQKTTGQGKLAAVGLPMEQAQAILDAYPGRVSFAAINSPSAVTLVGDPEAIDEIAKDMEAKQVFCRILKVEVPYHSHYMEPLKAELLSSLADLKMQEADLPLYSTVTGEAVEGEIHDAEYWWHNVRNPVLFHSATSALLNDGFRSFVEVSPNAVLLSSISETATKLELPSAGVASLRRNDPETTTMLTGLGKLYEMGVMPDWAVFYPTGNFVRLPTYAWNHQTYWLESNDARWERLGGADHALLGRRKSPASPTWDVKLDTGRQPFLADHKIRGAVVYPGAGYVEAAFAAGQQLFGAEALLPHVEDLEFKRALFMPLNDDVDVQFVVDAKDSTFSITSKIRETGHRTLHATGKIRPTLSKDIPSVEPMQAVRARCEELVDGATVYEQLKLLGLEYAARFQGLKHVWRGQGEAVAEIEIPEGVIEHLDQFNIHPAVLDFCLQTLAASLPPSADGQQRTLFPTGIKRCIRPSNKFTRKLWAVAQARNEGGTDLTGDVYLTNEDGELLFVIDACRTVTLDDNRTGEASKPQALYELQWDVLVREDANLDLVETVERGTWIICADAGGAGEQIARRLEDAGHKAVCVYANAISPTDESAVLETLRANAGSDEMPLRGVVHAWSLDTPVDVDYLNPCTIEAAQEIGATSAFLWAKALVMGDLHILPKPRLWLVSKGAQSIGTSDVNSPVHAPLWGLGRVFGHQEAPDMWGGLIDLDPVTHDVDDVAKRVAFELLHRDKHDQFVFRGDVCYAPRLTNSAFHLPELPPTLRSDASYLVTGGLGGIGLHMARWMVGRGARHLILMSRSMLPERKAWRNLPSDHAQFKQVQAVLDLEARGATVHLAAVDVSDDKQLAAYLQNYREENRPAIRGVIHSAGVASARIIPQMNVELFAEPQPAKVYGAWNLHTLITEPLDFFSLYSSVALVVCAPGQSAYAAANSFIDGLVKYRRSQGLPGMCVNWGPWRDAGMATDLGLLQLFAQRGLAAITAEQGTDMQAHLLACDADEVTVLGADWVLVGQWAGMGIEPEMLRELIDGARAAAAGGKEQEASTMADIHKLLAEAASDGARLLVLQDFMLEALARVLRCDKDILSAEQPLNTLGLDSMIAVELKNRMEGALKMEINIVDLLQGANIAAVATNLMAKLQPATGTPSTEAAPDTVLSDADLDKMLADIDGLTAEDIAGLKVDELSVGDHAEQVAKGQ